MACTAREKYRLKKINSMRMRSFGCLGATVFAWLVILGCFHYVKNVSVGMSVTIYYLFALIATFAVLFSAWLSYRSFVLSKVWYENDILQEKLEHGINEIKEY